MLVHSVQHELFAQGRQAVPGDDQPAGQQRAGEPAGAGRSGPELLDCRHRRDSRRRQVAGRLGGATAHGPTERGEPPARQPPGGGLGRPIDAPDGLAKYRWYILAALLTVLVGGGIWTRERTKLEEAARRLSRFASATPTPATRSHALASVRRRAIQPPRAIFCSPR